MALPSTTTIIVALVLPNILIVLLLPLLVFAFTYSAKLFVHFVRWWLHLIILKLPRRSIVQDWVLLQKALKYFVAEI